MLLMPTLAFSEHFRGAHLILTLDFFSCFSDTELLVVSCPKIAVSPSLCTPTLSWRTSVPCFGPALHFPLQEVFSYSGASSMQLASIVHTVSYYAGVFTLLVILSRKMH